MSSGSFAETLEDAARATALRPFGGVLRIECQEDGSSLWLDGRGEGVVVGEQAPPEVTSRYCLWRGAAPVLSTILRGQRRLETAFMAGQVKIAGDMAVMARFELGEAA